MGVSAILSLRRQDLRQFTHRDETTHLGCGVDGDQSVGMRPEQIHRSKKDKQDSPGETMYRMPTHEVANETKHGPMSTTDLILKNLLVFGSVVLVISVILYLIL